MEEVQRKFCESSACQVQERPLLIAHPTATAEALRWLFPCTVQKWCRVILLGFRV